MEGLFWGILRYVLAITIQQKMWPKMSQQQIDNLYYDGILLPRLERFGVLLSFLRGRFSVLSSAHIYVKFHFYSYLASARDSRRKNEASLQSKAH